MSVELVCLTCSTGLCRETLLDAGYIQCPICKERFTPKEEALTYVDEVPVEEYLGG